MNALFFDAGQAVRTDVRTVIDRHGFRRVVIALTGAMLLPARAPRAVNLDELSDHLRRDVGLPPSAETPSLRGLSARSGSGLL